jgi:hypothetical protein
MPCIREYRGLFKIACALIVAERAAKPGAGQRTVSA